VSIVSRGSTGVQEISLPLIMSGDKEYSHDSCSKIQVSGHKVDLSQLYPGSVCKNSREVISQGPGTLGKDALFHRAAGRSRLSVRQLDRLISELSLKIELLPIELPARIQEVSSSFKPLTAQQEVELFLHYNYARYKIYQLYRKYRHTRLSVTVARQLLAWKRYELKARSQIVQGNVPLVLALGKRTRLTGVDFTEFISEGNMALIRSVPKFDCARGFKFSTYACRAILKSFSRVASKTSRYRSRFPVEFDPALEKSDYQDVKRQDFEMDCVDELRSILGTNLAELSDVERTVICQRFGIGDDGQTTAHKTLEEVGKVVGVTKERVRQIQNRALRKLRCALEENILAV